MLHKYILDAIDELENRSKKPSLINKQDEQFDVIIDLIAYETNIDLDKLRITEETYKQRLESIIGDIADSENPVDDFHSKLDKLEDEIGNTHHEYTILFPWKLSNFLGIDFERPIQIRGLTIERLPKSTWEEYVEEAKAKDTFNQFLEELPTQKERNSPFAYHKYWRITYEAGSQDYVMNKLTNAFQILMGKIIFSAHFGRISRKNRYTNWKYGITDLQHPLCYLILREGDYHRYYTSYDFTPRRRYSLQGRKKRNFNEIYPRTPDFTGDIDKVEQHLMTAFSAYHSGMSEPKPDQAFLNFWRCIEAATLTQDEDYSASDAPKRARAAMRPQRIGISDGRINRLVDKRNHLVHRGGHANITDGDITHLKSLSEASIWFLMTDKQNYSFEEFKFFFEYGAKSEGSIRQAKEQRESQITENKDEIQIKEEEISRIKQIMKWLEMEDN